jgi:multicomponent Na+:H+ antiporter subunit A
MAAMIGLVLADNLLLLFVFWELTTLFSYLLIGFENESDRARANARQALLVTGAGGLALLIGILMLGSIVGTYALTALPEKIGIITNHSLYLPLLAMIFLGAFTKSAQFPFHFWLPNAMSAPTPISAFLHSATMVKAGIYLLARLHPILGGTPEWMGTLVMIGGVTALIGSLRAMRQTDLKRILAFTTVMALGILTMFLGGKTTPALTAAMTFFLVHSLYKSALFLVAGIIDHQTGTRQIDRLGGLLRPLPFTAFAATAAALSMAGFPLFFGFIGKEILYKGALTEDMFPVFATTAALLSNSLMTAVAGVIVIKSFLGPLKETPRVAAEAPVSMWLGPVLLAGLCILFGIIPEWVSRWLVEPAVRAVHWTPENIKLKLFYGFNYPLLLSVATLSLGTVFYFLRARIRRFYADVFKQLPFAAEHLYRYFLGFTDWLSTRQTRVLQNGSLHRYLAVIVGTVILGTGLPFVRNRSLFATLNLTGNDPPAWLVAALIAAGVILVLSTRSRLLAICGLGVVGAAIALLFLMFGAPDVALTQLLVETLTVIIVSLVLLRLPRMNEPRRESVKGKWLNAFLALAAGGLVTSLILAVTAIELDRSLTAYFEANSYIAAHGRNIVNVILVDFRSLDTLGEITVVAVAGLAGYALIRAQKGTS